jgi:hypothetical protein
MAKLVGGSRVYGALTVDGALSAKLVPRILTSTLNVATPALNTDLYDMMILTGQTVAITSFTTNLTGTPVNGQKLWIAITGTSGLSITMGASFSGSFTIALPTSLPSASRFDMGFIWNATSATWMCIATA